jgi:hypothetical protein
MESLRFETLTFHYLHVRSAEVRCEHFMPQDETDSRPAAHGQLHAFQ